MSKVTSHHWNAPHFLPWEYYNIDAPPPNPGYKSGIIFVGYWLHTSRPMIWTASGPLFIPQSSSHVFGQRILCTGFLVLRGKSSCRSNLCSNWGWDCRQAKSKLIVYYFDCIISRKMFLAKVTMFLRVLIGKTQVLGGSPNHVTWLGNFFLHLSTLLPEDTVTTLRADVKFRR